MDCFLNTSLLVAILWVFHIPNSKDGFITDFRLPVFHPILRLYLEILCIMVFISDDRFNLLQGGSGNLLSGCSFLKFDQINFSCPLILQVLPPFPSLRITYFFFIIEIIDFLFLTLVDTQVLIWKTLLAPITCSLHLQKYPISATGMYHVIP